MSAESKQRLFIAVPIPVEVREALAQAQKELRGILPVRRVSWAKPENFHLTIRFLGDVAACRVDELRDLLSEVVRFLPALHLVCERLGCFPDLRFPRVVWARVHEEQDRLAAVAQQIDATVTGISAQPLEEDFVGHITLARPGRIRRIDTEALARFVGGSAVRRFGSWRADRVELIQSELSSQGSHYRVLNSFLLQRSSAG